MEQSITDFLSGLSKSIIQGFGNSLKESMEKFRKKVAITVVAISLIGIGFFLTLWGIASAIDMMFTMRGLGYVLIGLLAVLTGALVFKK